MEEVSKSIKKEFDSKPLYNKKYLKTETKSYRRKTTTNFNEIPKEGSQRICLLAIFINSVFSEQVKIIILKSFLKNLNMLLQKK